MKKVFCYISVLISLSGSAQSSIKLPNDYVQKELPKEHSQEFHSMNYSSDTSIELNGNTIKTFETPRRQNTEFKFNDGLLVGSNHGEWGGKLVYKISKKETLIKKGNIITIFKLDGKIYFVEGLAHLSFNYGVIYELKYAGNKFTYEKIFELPDEPEVFEIVNNKIFIATYEHFLIINDWKTEYQITGFWGSLYPNSLIIENDNSIYIGMRGGIVHLIPKTNTINLYSKI